MTKDLAIEKDMIPYMKCEEYTIWANTTTHSFYIQMSGESTEEKQWVSSADAITEAEGRK